MRIETFTRGIVIAAAASALIVIDVVVSSVLMSMGMFMLPPAMISLPFKLLLFVLVDGWQLVVGTLMTSVVQPP